MSLVVDAISGPSGDDEEETEASKGIVRSVEAAINRVASNDL